MIKLCDNRIAMLFQIIFDWELISLCDINDLNEGWANPFINERTVKSIEYNLI